MSKSGNYNMGEIEKRDEMIQELVEALEEILGDIDQLRDEFKICREMSVSSYAIKARNAISRAKGETL
jgi:hypothetical protein